MMLRYTCLSVAVLLAGCVTPQHAMGHHDDRSCDEMMKKMHHPPDMGKQPGGKDAAHADMMKKCPMMSHGEAHSPAAPQHTDDANAHLH